MMITDLIEYSVCDTYQGEKFQGEIGIVRHRRVRQDQGELFHLPDGGRVIGQFGERVGRSGAGAAGAAVVGAHRGTSSPLTESAVGAVAAAAATGPILLSTVILVVRRIMIAQSGLLLARGLQPERPTKNLIQSGHRRRLEISVIRNRDTSNNIRGNK